MLLKMLLRVVTLRTKLTLPLHYNANSVKSETVVHSITQNIIPDEYIEIGRYLVVHVTRLSYVHFQSVAFGI